MTYAAMRRGYSKKIGAPTHELESSTSGIDGGSRGEGKVYNNDCPEFGPFSEQL